MISRYEVDIAVLGRLRLAHPDIGSGARVELESAPDDISPPYGILYPIPGGSTWGSRGEPDTDGTFHYRVTAVGTEPAKPNSPTVIRVALKQANALADTFRAAMVDRTVEIAGQEWRVIDRRHLVFGGVQTSGPIVNIVDDFEVVVAHR